MGEGDREGEMGGWVGRVGARGMRNDERNGKGKELEGRAGCVVPSWWSLMEY